MCLSAGVCVCLPVRKNRIIIFDSKRELVGSVLSYVWWRAFQDGRRHKLTDYIFFPNPINVGSKRMKALDS